MSELQKYEQEGFARELAPLANATAAGHNHPAPSVPLNLEPLRLKRQGPVRGTGGAFLVNKLNSRTRFRLLWELEDASSQES